MARGDSRKRARSSEYAVIYRFMTEGMGLRGTYLLVYARVFSFCKYREGGFYESRRSTGEFLGISERQVHRAVSWLVGRGLILEEGERVLDSGKVTKRYVLDEEAVRAAMRRVDGLRRDAPRSG